MQQPTINVLATLALLAAVGGVAPASTDEGHSPIPPEKMQKLEPQVVAIDDFQAQGPILAIGGGGECVIGQLKGEQVVAIDISRRELEEAPGEALKIVMDARDLKFLGESFDVAASFFTLMYINGSDHPKVFEEVYRVLQPGGRFLVWDAVLGPPADDGKTVVVIPLTVKLPDTEIQTGYGVNFPPRTHDLGYYKRLGRVSGFELVSERSEEHWFHLVLRKPKP
jgi:SAM-dependent methyltransferase